MTIARAHLVDPSVTRWYHCVTRCVRRAFLLGEGMHDRKSWIEQRLQELAEIFSVAVAGFAILDNHLHLLVRLDPDLGQGWSDEDVVRRWGRLFPPRDKARQVVEVSEEWVQARLKDARWVATARLRLQSLSWSCCAYIDLNPVATGIAEVPEASAHTSIKQRVEHVKEQGRTEDLNAAQAGSVAGSTAAVGLEEGLWLCPIEDRRRLDSLREGMNERFSQGNYLLLVEYTGRLFRDGKALISSELAGVFERLGSDAENWQARLHKLTAGRLLGRFFAASRARLREVALRLGVHHLANLGGCVAR